MVGDAQPCQDDPQTLPPHSEHEHTCMIICCLKSTMSGDGARTRSVPGVLELEGMKSQAGVRWRRFRRRDAASGVGVSMQSLRANRY